MRTSLPLLGICLLCCGCSKPADTEFPEKIEQSSVPNITQQSALPQVTVSPVAKPANISKSDVKITLPDIKTGSTHELRAEGACNLSVHDRTNPLEFELQGRISYRVRISNGPFVKDTWHINPLVDVTNESGSLLYVGYYAAFFNKAGRLVGCCGQQLEAQPSARPMQLGSLVVEGPKAKLLTATDFEIVIYESDQRIGVDPISAEAARTLVGRSGKVISKLQQIDTSVIPSEGHQELRILANLAFEEPVEKNRNTHLKIKSATNYDIYLATSLSPHIIQKPLDQDERFDAWETDVEFERRNRVKGVSTNVHAALLDGLGRLIVCSSSGYSRRLAAPKDKLLSANRLDLVAYESGGTTQSAQPEVASNTPRKVAVGEPQAPEVSPKTAPMEPRGQAVSKTTDDTPPAETVPEIDRPNEKGFAQLHEAALSGNVDMAKKLIAEGANVNVPQQEYRGTPLQYAAARGDLEVMRLLIKAGATIDSKDSSGRTPLVWTVQKNQPKAAGLLLEAGGDPFDHKLQLAIGRLQATDNKEFFKTFDDYFAKQSSAEWIRWQVTTLKLTVEREERTLSLNQASEPTLRYPENATDDSLWGRLDIWTTDQIPFAVSSHLMLENGKMLRSLALLRETPVKASLRDETIWQPAKRDHIWSPVPNAEPVRGNDEQRLQQMQAIAQRFSMAGRPLRPDPVLRYVNDLDGHKIVDAGVFVFLKKNAAHALLIVEAWGDKAQWRYTLARLTAPPASIQLDGETVFEWTGYWASPRKSDDDFIEQPSMRRR